MSFGSVEEGQLGLLKSSISRKVLFDPVLYPGHYHTGPTHNIQTVNARIQSVHLEGNGAWTCPETDSGTCDNSGNNTGTNNIGIKISSSFSILYKIKSDKLSIEEAYRRFRFDDDLAATTIRTLATENSKQTPQTHTLQQIIEAHETNTTQEQFIVNEEQLRNDMSQFGYEFMECFIHSITLEERAKKKYMETEVRRYEDDLAEIVEEASVVRRNTESLVKNISNHATQEVYAIKGRAEAYKQTLDADKDVYKRTAELNATIELSEMFRTSFPTANDAEIMAIVMTNNYVDQISQIANKANIDKVFIDESTNKLRVENI